jgi:hypothetical protein
MDNRIRRIEVIDHSLDPVSAEVWISVHPEHDTAATVVRGRLMGPRCLYSNTVEVAYPLRPMPARQEQPELSGLTARVLIPEGSLWEPQCPFLYQGPVEIWQDGQLADRVILSHGLRSLKRKEHVLFVNGRPLTLHGRRINGCSDTEATELRQSGYNLLIAPVAANSLTVWEQADRFGFLVLGQLVQTSEQTRLIEVLRHHASCLGWLPTEQGALSAEEAVAWFLAHGNPEAM